MARPLRIEYPGAFYHVMNRGLERREIFRSPKDYDAFLSLCNEIHKRFQIIFHAYSLMPNHYHLMVETPQGSLSRAMRHLDGVYTQGFNKRKKRVGPLFQGRYKAILIDKDSYALQLARYIHLNPVKAKLVKGPGEHAYTSYRYYLESQKQPDFLETSWLLGQFHKNITGAKISFNQFTLNGLVGNWEPGGGLQGGMILGGEDFYEKIRSKYLEGREDKEIPHLKCNQGKLSVNQIRSCVEKCCVDNPLSKRLFVWGLKQHTSLKLREIAEVVESALSYSAVSQICRRVELESRKNKTIYRCMEQIKIALSNVKT